MSTIQDQITSIAQQYNVSPTLALAVAQQESGFNQNAVSSAGAIGVFQLMPATAAGLGVDPTDLTGNITGGIKYLAQLLNQFGSVPLALAAYNAGPGTVNQYGGIPPYPETQNYVSNILASLGLSSETGSTISTPVPTDTSSSESGFATADFLPGLSNLLGGNGNGGLGAGTVGLGLVGVALAVYLLT